MTDVLKLTYSNLEIQKFFQESTPGPSTFREGEQKGKGGMKR